MLAQEARAESLEVQVNRAIERGVAVARTHLDGNGVGRTHYHAAYPEGDTALVLYTLIKSGVSPEDPVVAKGLAWLSAREMTKVYSAAVYVLALDALKDKAWDAKIAAAANWIEGHLHPESRRWNYPGGNTDLSNTQYAVLGLWAAERHGFRARADTWAALLTGVVELRQADDGFGYHADSKSAGSMTVAGLTVLELALARAPSDELLRSAEVRHRARTALEKGWANLERRFSTDGNPVGAHGFREDWFHYYLYGVERLCAIAGKDRIGAHDWYAEGARALVATQKDDGSWGEPWNTCFALLFLRRATFTTMDRALTPLAGPGVAGPETPPARPRPEVPFVRRWLLLGPLPDPDDDLLEKSSFDESRASPRPLAYSGANCWNVLRSLRDEVDLSGDDPKAATIACAFTWLHATRDTDAAIWFGHDNGCRVWLDGRLVHDRHFEEAYGPDSFSIRARLTQGAHRLLFKVQNYGGTHALWMRVAHVDGTAAPEVIPSLLPEDSELEANALAHPESLALEDLECLMPREKRLRLTFDDPSDLDRIAFSGGYWPYPLWADDPATRPHHFPNPGATGVFAFHAVDDKRPAFAYWRVKLPEKPHLRIRVSATTKSAPGRADAVLRIGVFDGELHWLADEPVGPDAAADAKNWRFVETDLGPFAGREALVVLAAVNGGRTNWYYEGIWVDEMEIRSGL